MNILILLHLTCLIALSESIKSINSINKYKLRSQNISLRFNHVLPPVDKFMAIIYSNNCQSSCGGVFIAPTVILTTANCAKIGIARLRVYPNLDNHLPECHWEQIPYPIFRIKFHPSHNLTNDGLSSDNLALIVLYNSAHQYVEPIGLIADKNTVNQAFHSQENHSLYYWSASHATELIKMPTLVVNSSSCQKYYTQTLPDKTFCALTKLINDNCLKDEGFPIVWESSLFSSLISPSLTPSLNLSLTSSLPSLPKRYLIGIIAHGSCAGENCKTAKTLIANVTSQMTWIVNELRNMSINLVNMAPTLPNSLPVNVNHGQIQIVNINVNSHNNVATNVENANSTVYLIGNQTNILNISENVENTNTNLNFGDNNHNNNNNNNNLASSGDSSSSNNNNNNNNNNGNGDDDNNNNNNNNNNHDVDNNPPEKDPEGPGEQPVEEDGNEPVDDAAVENGEDNNDGSGEVEFESVNEDEENTFTDNGFSTECYFGNENVCGNGEGNFTIDNGEDGIVTENGNDSGINITVVNEDDGAGGGDGGSGGGESVEGVEGGEGGEGGEGDDGDNKRPSNNNNNNNNNNDNSIVEGGYENEEDDGNIDTPDSELPLDEDNNDNVEDNDGNGDEDANENDGGGGGGGESGGKGKGIGNIIGNIINSHEYEDYYDYYCYFFTKLKNWKKSFFSVLIKH